MVLGWFLGGFSPTVRDGSFQFPLAAAAVAFLYELVWSFLVWASYFRCILFGTHNSHIIGVGAKIVGKSRKNHGICCFPWASVAVIEAMTQAKLATSAI